MRAHFVEHLVGELAASKLARDVAGFGCGHGVVLALLEFMNELRMYLLVELNSKGSGRKGNRGILANHCTIL